LFVVQDKTYKNFYGYLDNGYWAGVRRFDLNEPEIFIYISKEKAQAFIDKYKVENAEVKEIIWSYNYEANVKWDATGYREWGKDIPKLCYKVKE
jgi:hypothetical protein